MSAIMSSGCSASLLASHQARENHLRDFGMLGKMVRHCNGVVTVLAHSQHHRLKTLNEHKGIERRHGRTDVAQQRYACLGELGGRPGCLHRLGPTRGGVARVGCVQQWKGAGMPLPVKTAAVNDDATDRRAVTTDIFRGRMHDDSSAMLKRFA